MSAALFPGVCWVCEHTFGPGAEIVLRKGDYIHAACAPGGSDE